MYDLHIHSKNSHDSLQTLDEICVSAIEKNLTGIAVCDHVDMGPCDVPDTIGHMSDCIVEVNEAKGKYGHKLEILQGIEMAEYLYDTPQADEVLKLCNYDVILGSVHYVDYDDIKIAYSKIKFDDSFTDKKLYGYLKAYFAKIKEMIEKTDFDVLSHLTCPLRYVNGKYGRNVDVMWFEKEICEILKMIIEKNIAMEINTSGMNGSIEGMLPETSVVQMYANMGGRLITIGSDAHIPDRIGNSFEVVSGFLKSIGFEKYCYYKQRKPQFMNL